MPASFAFLIDTNSLPSSSFLTKKLTRKSSSSIPSSSSSLLSGKEGSKAHNDSTLSTNYGMENPSKSQSNAKVKPFGLKQDLKANGLNHNSHEANLDLGCEQSDMIKLIQDFILLRMSEKTLSRDKKEFGSMNDVKWTYKTFDSSQESDSSLGKKFEYFSESSLNTLKKDVIKDWKKNSKKGNSQENNSLFLSSALKKLLSDLSWEESGSNEEQAIYILMAVPRTNNDMLEFTNNHPIVSSNGSTKEFVQSLLPKDFIHAIRKKYKIQINFVDVNNVRESFPSESDIAEDYHKIIQPMLCYLNYGKLYSLLRFPQGPFGLPSYIDFLKMNLNLQTKIFEMNDMKKMNKTHFFKSIPSLGVSKSKKSEDASSHVSKNSSFSSVSRKSESIVSSHVMQNGHESLSIKKGRISNGIETRLPVKFNSQVELKTEGRYAALNKAKRRLMNSNSSTSLTSHSSSSQSLPSLQNPGEKEQSFNFASLFEKGNNKRFQSPKKSFRRNLFNSQRTSEANDLKSSLLASSKLGTKFNRTLFQSKKHSSPALLPSPLAKVSSDSFMSPGSSMQVMNSPSSDFIFKSPGLPLRASPRPGCSKRLSPYAINSLLTAPYCKRKLELEEPRLPESPIFQKNKIICPESPVTPIQMSKNGNNGEREIVIAESPETADSKYDETNESQMNYSRFSFYSNGVGKRSKAWEKSGKELLAAKMKESMVHSSAHLSLTFNTQYSQDIEGSPQRPEPRLQLVSETENFLNSHEEATST